jgi:predicted nucleic acid-binding protein
VRVLIDTNILLRALQRSHPASRTARLALLVLHRHGYTLCLTLQNLTEFWNVCTRPQTVNGLGFSIESTNQHVMRLERFFTILPDSVQVIQNWRQLVVAHAVRGVQVHDTRLVATMKTYNIPQIVTFNVEDFARFPDIEVVHPQSLAQDPR